MTLEQSIIKIIVDDWDNFINQDIKTFWNNNKVTESNAEKWIQTYFYEIKDYVEKDMPNPFLESVEFYNAIATKITNNLLVSGNDLQYFLKLLH